MKRDEIDLNKISKKYGNKTNQLANWMRSLTVTDYGYKYLKKESYSEEQIGPWVRRQPAEKKSYVINKSSPENSGENLLRNGENSENLKSSPENLLRNGENSENPEDENLRIPKPEGNKGTVSKEGFLTLSHNPQQFSGEEKNSQQFSGENIFSQVSHLSQLSPERLSHLSA